MKARELSLRQRMALEIERSLQNRRVAEHRLDTLFWECTLRCNLACRHCGSDCMSDPAYRDMPAEDFFRVLDTQITSHVDPHKVFIILSGGEVLVRNDIERIGLELYRREYAWGLVTNGMALSRRRFDSLLAAGLHGMTVSLDGFEPQHTHIRRNPESYRRAVEAVRMAAAEPTLAFDVVTCATPLLMPHLEEFKEFLISLGLKRWRIFTIFPAGRAANDPTLRLSDEDFVSLMEFIRRTRKEKRINLNYGCEGFLGGYEAEVRSSFYECHAGTGTASIRIDGAISGCTSIRADYNQGNIYKDDFWDVWQNRFEVFRNREWTHHDQCAECGVFRYCRGGGMHLRDDKGCMTDCAYLRLYGK